jgi:hypothetical protein
VAVDAGHAQVEQHQRRPEGGQGRQRGAAVVRHADLGAEEFEQHAEAVGRVAVVVDDEHARPR